MFQLIKHVVTKQNLQKQRDRSVDLSVNVVKRQYLYLKCDGEEMEVKQL